MRIRLPSIATCAALLVAATAATATPARTETAATPNDAVLQLLEQQALPEAPAQGANFVRQVRDRASELVVSAMHFIGVPYRRGGTSETSGFDCSGFTRHIFERSVGLVLPHRAEEQAGLAGLGRVARDELKPGDLVFFNTMKRAFSHVGIYVGEGKFIHSPRAGGEVRVEDMRQSYWVKRYNGARRALLGTVPSIEAVATP